MARESNIIEEEEEQKEMSANDLHFEDLDRSQSIN
jgi:hypothetical protein